MNYKFESMTQDQAEDIAFNWHYDGEYSFYDMAADKEDLEEVANLETRGNSKYAVTNNSELVGFFSVNKVDDKKFDIDLGMRPDLTDKGKGSEFLKADSEFVKNEYKPEKITLFVATFNQRAIKLYCGWLYHRR